MKLNPESQAIINKLNESQTVSATRTKVGPFNQIAKDVLLIIIENYEVLNSLPGESRAKKFLEHYKSIQKRGVTDSAKAKQAEGIEKQQGGTTQGNSEQSKWYIHSIECHSIRGIASYRETFPFSFEGKSNLVYGPNGSGKSSLLGAVIWAFTDITITDASDNEQKTDIHQKTTGTKKGRRVRSDWPLISTLPESNDIGSIVPDSWVRVELKTKDQSKTLHIERSLVNGLKAGFDANAMKSCQDLAEYGIKPLDLQISLIAPTVLSRNTLDNASDVIKILSMILGFDLLTDIGRLAALIGTNRTRYANDKQADINLNWSSLQDKLPHLADPLAEQSPIREKLQDILVKKKPTLKDLNGTNILIQEEIDAANKNVAEILDVDSKDKGSIEGLADKLIEAIAYLEKDFEVIFPSFAEVQYNAEQHDNKTITEIEECFTAFCAQARKRIQQRIDWWKREKEEGSKLSLKLRASNDYNIEKMLCPVCDQSIKDLPLKDELANLKSLDPELQRELKDFFNDLLSELKIIIPDSIANVSQSSPPKRILSDWTNIKNSMDKRLNGIVNSYEPTIQSLCGTLDDISVVPPVSFDEDDVEFIAESATFVGACTDSLKAIAILKWGDANFAKTKKRLEQLLSSSEESSLKGVLSKSKTKAVDVKPLNTIKAQLGDIIKLRETIAALEDEHELIEKLETPIDEIKKLSDYALERTEEVFNEIKVVSDKNWRLMYPESPTGLTPSKLVLERGKTVEPFLSKQDYEVAGKYFANAGLQRSIALSFLCALIEKDDGASFVLFDDPILSLDEDHRERWSHRILNPIMADRQVILTTHQELFVTNCGQDFLDGRIIRLNRRAKNQRLSAEPGYLIEQAEYWLDRKWEYANDLLYQYVEYLLETLDSYSPVTFFNKDRIKDSFEAYKNLPDGNPLNSKKKSTIVNVLTQCFTDDVFRKRHLSTGHQVTEPMTADTLAKLKDLDHKAFRIELARLKKLREKEIKDTVIKKSVGKDENVLKIDFNDWGTIPIIGRAAARPESWVIDEAENVTKVALPKFACAHVTGHTFDPVARCGQCILLSDSSIIPVDNDLVVAESTDQKRYLRRVSFVDEVAYLCSINPLRTTAPLQLEKTTVSLNRVVGVLYEPCKNCKAESSNGNEWHPCKNIDPSYFADKKLISVEGDSMEPIARKGQKVLVTKGMPPAQCGIESGGLAVIETDVESVGNEIKRVYPKKDSWILTSANPLELYTPDIIPIAKIKRVWPLKGVLFEVAESLF